MKKSLIVGIAMGLILQVPVNTYAASPIAVSSINGIIETDAPAIPTESSYAVTQINIRANPSKESAIIGGYKKGDKITILSTEGEWAKTDRGYIWGGYIAKSYNYDFDLQSDSENASKYMGYVYDIMNELDAEYAAILQGYEIHVCDNPDTDILNKAPDHVTSPFQVINGVTYLSNRDGGVQLMYLRAEKKSLKETIYHELAHAIDYKDFRMLSDNQIVTQSKEQEGPLLKGKYDLKSIVDNDEYFAEAFRIKMQDPDGLQKTAPMISEFFNSLTL